MQDTNEQIDEAPCENPEATPAKNTARPRRPSNLRSRYGQKNSGTSNTISTEAIGEIQLPLGETLKDDLTPNSDAARSKGGERRQDSRDDGRTQSDHEGKRGERKRSRRGHRGERHRQEQRASDSDGGAEQHRGRDETPTKENIVKQDGGRTEGQAISNQDDRQQRVRRKSHKRSGRSSRRKGNRSESDEDIKPATWNAGDLQGESLLGKAGKFLSSIFGGSKQQPKPKTNQASEKTKGQQNSGRRRRRKRSRHGNRGGQGRT